ncbi:hypothetical protein COCMIDRAFT_38013 [Bipolaris oryzae ATCC 44560]|uniref:F-box domain-containing protein n=1 Tax=Bipolaris oryzae ATCC 44560 TaxID=930090 RepID=W6Z2B8_COCMI|nr:uncharacterized protein COCMIDRAFT_38013 [Bipolaris oryzae ATCC 44560]EUC44120.1 hypothetical protein COCMIDRAFT_38013 [Bipolaris oryzae ATCC 44560]
MNNLPQEIVDEICSYIPREDLKNVLTLNRQFRFGAERYSGFFDEYTIKEDNIEFLSRYSCHRLLYLKEVIFRPILPPVLEPPEGEELPCRESAEEIREKDESFTRQVQHLFNTLSLLEQQAGEMHASGRYQLSVHSLAQDITYFIWCPHRLYVSWRVHLLTLDLPEIASVHSLEIHNNGNDKYRESKLDLRVIIDLAAKFPNLEYLGCKTGGFEWHETAGEIEPETHFKHDWEGPRRDARHDFANAVSSPSFEFPKSLTRASLDFLNPLTRAVDISQSRPLPDLVGPAVKDMFSSSLAILSNNLHQLHIKAMVDESLFSKDASTRPCWPNLEILEVVFHPAHPNGSWYFHGPQGEGRDVVGFEVTDEHYPPYEKTELDEEMEYLHDEKPNEDPHDGNSQYRITPDENRLRPFLQSFAEAAIHMTFLKSACLWSPLNWSSRRLDWAVGLWRPDAELHGLFQKIGDGKYGDDLDEEWVLGKGSENPLVTRWTNDRFFSDELQRITFPY